MIFQMGVAKQRRIYQKTRLNRPQRLQMHHVPQPRRQGPHRWRHPEHPRTDALYRPHHPVNGLPARARQKHSRTKTADFARITQNAVPNTDEQAPTPSRNAATFGC